jgi:hypothetical protein
MAVWENGGSINAVALVLFIVIFLCTLVFKKVHPSVFIGVSAVMGVIFML